MVVGGVEVGDESCFLAGGDVGGEIIDIGGFLGGEVVLIDGDLVDLGFGFDVASFVGKDSAVEFLKNRVMFFEVVDVFRLNI